MSNTLSRKAVKKTGGPANDDLEAILVAYGSNLSSGAASASQSFGHVVKTLEENGVIVTKFSRLWQSQAWPDPSDPPYVNAMLQVKTELQPVDLMMVL
ncbi:MAG: 2-amino-4-hydroxy-6-hydroxymethyldihydropteridine diphosphokinase, partial [Asticcacaulis sp.]|nr:2-amino-4-hydroxy-6-hydroxymethyldihydropteridine diphosphokinase [Asticcacaulis sp.]